MPSLSWLHPAPPLYSLPKGIKRTYVSTPDGNLELLVAEPADPSAPRKAPIFFAHGGCGSASVWVEFMTYFAQHNIPCYALSYRGHGASWYPFWLRMFFLAKRTFANDLVTGVKYVEKIEAEKTGQSVKVVLVGHSSGGGISQVALDAGDVNVKGLALLGAIPGFGSVEINKNWMMFDKLFMIRMYFWHFGHPMSPLSSTRLVKQAFFCDAYPWDKVQEFESRMPRFESFAWPMSMSFAFVKFQNVLRNIIGGTRDKVAVIAGGCDRLVTPAIAKKTAEAYRSAMRDMVSSKKIEASESKTDGVSYQEVKGAGHHFQNDLQWEDAAGKLLSFYDQLF